MIILELSIYAFCTLWLITGAITHNLAVVCAMTVIVCVCAYAGARTTTPPPAKEVGGGAIHGRTDANGH